MQLTVATITRPHGLRGELVLMLRTDDPELRLAVGTVLSTDPPSAGPLTVTASRNVGGRWYVTFAEAGDRTAAEQLRGVDLVVEEEPSVEDDAWYPAELVGLRVELTDGTVVGEVVALEHLPAQDALVVAEDEEVSTLVPFVRAIVPTVDLAGGRVVIDPPRGLLARDGDVGV